LKVDKSEIEARIVNVVREVFSLDEDAPVLDKSFSNDLEASSLDMMTLFVALEDEFQRTIPQERVEGIDTAREIVEYVARELEAETA
jgi:acyl carrier protein